MSSPAPPSEQSAAVAFSVVVPFYQESEGATSFLLDLADAVNQLGETAEVILVDDGSTDGTAEILQQVANAHPHWRVLRQPVNQGQAAAMYRAMHAARAPLIVTLDGDGQNDPGDIGALLRTQRETGADMVAGRRVERNDSWLRRRMSTVANKVRGRILRDGVHDAGCGIKVFRREVVESFLPIRTLYSFMPALAVAAGFRVVETPVRHRARQAGQSKYGLGVMLWRPLLDMLGIWWFAERRFAVQPKEGARD